MKKSNEVDLENEIGDLGGTETSIGKKLKYQSESALSDDEQKSMDAFLNRAKTHDAFKDADPIETPYYSAGWIEIDRRELGIRSNFYPEDWRFYIRPATVEAIKNWSSIDEERPDIINNVCNDIIRECVSIRTAAGNTPWNKLNSWDRMWFILKVRELTFAHGETKIEFTDNCPDCDEEITFVLTSDHLHYEFPDEEIVTKHWNAEERAWYIDPKEYGLEANSVKLFVPTLEKDQACWDWAFEKVRNKKKIDEVFLRFLPFMLSKAPKDEKVLDKFINNCYGIYKSWNVDMFEFMDEVVRNITINPSEQLKQTCPHCGEEVVSTTRFPNGVKQLFKSESKHKRFGSR